MFAENLAPFFNTDTLGSVATYKGATQISGVLETAYQEAGGYVESTAPVFICAAASVPGVAHGDALVIGGTNYQVAGVQPDSTGTVLSLVLEKQ